MGMEMTRWKCPVCTLILNNWTPKCPACGGTLEAVGPGSTGVTEEELLKAGYMV